MGCVVRRDGSGAIVRRREASGVVSAVRLPRVAATGEGAEGDDVAKGGDPLHGRSTQHGGVCAAMGALSHTVHNYRE